MSVVAQAVAPVEDRWPSDRAPSGDVLEEVLFASHLLGSNRAVANYGGGNTSAKGIATDHVGREVRAMWVKGSGSDLATMSASDFTPLRLDEVLPLFGRDAMSDEDMVAHLARCQLDPAAPRSSIETLLHAFIPAAHVHHTHPDAINVLACAGGGAELIAECLGYQAAWVEYIRPGFTLAKLVGEAVRADSQLRVVVLAKHGLVTWGDTAPEAYERTVWACNRAAELANRKTHGMPRFGGPSPRSRGLDVEARTETLREVLPALRGAVSSERSKILIADLSPAVLELVDGASAAEVTNVGAACPDHLVHTKRFAMWVPYDPAIDSIEALTERLLAAAPVYRKHYAAYVERHRDADTEPGDPDPRVILIENIGLVAAGTTVRAASLSRDLYHRAIEVMAGASAITEFVSLDEAESFAGRVLAARAVQAVAGAAARRAAGQGRARHGRRRRDRARDRRRASAAGACIVAFDIDGDGAVDAVRELGDRGVAARGDVTSEDDVREAFGAAIDAFGGVDIVVSNAGIASTAPIEETTLAEWNRNQSILGTGYFLVAREAFRVLRAQRIGGSVVFVASKNALVAGQNAAAYSSAKAAELHLARCLAEEGGSGGIRVNTVNPDAVLHGSRIWDSSWREERAAAYGIAPDELEEHYRNRTVLGVHILPEDIAQAVMHFASPARSGKSTGNLLNVDGGVTAAYPR